MLRHHLVRRPRTVAATSWTLHRLDKGAADWLDVERVLLSARANDFDSDHEWVR
jgi:hypothetical protein